MLFKLTDLVDVVEDDGEFFGSGYTNNAENHFEFDLTAEEYGAYREWQATGVLSEVGAQASFEGWGYYVG